MKHHPRHKDLLILRANALDFTQAAGAMQLAGSSGRFWSWMWAGHSGMKHSSKPSELAPCQITPCYSPPAWTLRAGFTVFCADGCSLLLGEFPCLMEILCSFPSGCGISK